MVTCDGTWSKRGHITTYGVVATITARPAKPTHRNLECVGAVAICITFYYVHCMIKLSLLGICEGYGCSLTVSHRA